MSDSLNQSIPEKFREMAKILLDHEKDPQHPAAVEVRSFIQKAADGGDTYANYIIATWHSNGVYGYDYDADAIRERFVRAIKGMHAEALYEYAVFCREGPVKNNKLAFGYFLAAALLGDEDALYNLSACFELGIGTYKNEEISLLLDNVAKCKVQK